MYIARRKLFGPPEYCICQSVQEDGQWVHRHLFNLGPDPAMSIVYPGGNAFYIKEDIEEELADQGICVDPLELESLFWPFIDPEIRYILERFEKRRKRSPFPEGDIGAIHLFDKRRLYYLRCGRLDQADLCHITDKLYKPLLQKSRDELEQYFLGLERELPAREYKQYVFAIFDLQKHFPNWMFSKELPQTLNRGRLDQYFLEELCLLNNDSQFWVGFNPFSELHEYLSRYAVMYFDYEFPSFDFEDAFIRQFMGRRRTFSWPEAKISADEGEVKALFGRELRELKKMSRKSLTRLYRHRAKKMHPDSGGGHEIFVKLTEVYKQLLAGK